MSRSGTGAVASSPRLCAVCGVNAADDCFTVCSPCWDKEHPKLGEPAQQSPQGLPTNVEEPSRAVDREELGRWLWHATDPHGDGVYEHCRERYRAAAEALYQRGHDAATRERGGR